MLYKPFMIIQGSCKVIVSQKYLETTVSKQDQF